MSAGLLQDKWKQLSAGIRQQLDKLVHDKHRRLGVSREKLLRELQEVHGYTREQAQRAVDDFLSKIH